MLLQNHFPARRWFFFFGKQGMQMAWEPGQNHNWRTIVIGNNKLNKEQSCKNQHLKLQKWTARRKNK
jgi:hypothetical protein